MRVLQINTSAYSGSTGRIAGELGGMLERNGHKSYIASRQVEGPGQSVTVKIGDKSSYYFHALKTRLFDQHGFGSGRATENFIRNIKEIDPDLIHLHNIHGYYLHAGILFEYLKRSKKPVVWTFHDCWPFTGHCSYFDRFSCDKWETGCNKCPAKRYYPASWLIDNSIGNYAKKRHLFNSLDQLVIITPSVWLSEYVRRSFLKTYEIRVINNGIDLNRFQPSEPEKTRSVHKLTGKHMILGVASPWSERKGLTDFIKLRSMLNPEIDIVLVGVSSRQLRRLPAGIKGIMRTESTTELAALYSTADVYVNPTYVDNFPTVNLESLACGTPVITYDTGGSPESVSPDCGYVVPKGNVIELSEAIIKMLSKGKVHYTEKCRERAKKYYNKDERLKEYVDLYTSLAGLKS